MSNKPFPLTLFTHFLNNNSKHRFPIHYKNISFSLCKQYMQVCHFEGFANNTCKYVILKVRKDCTICNSNNVWDETLGKKFSSCEINFLLYPEHQTDNLPLDIKLLGKYTCIQTIDDVFWQFLYFLLSFSPQWRLIVLVRNAESMLQYY